MKSVKVHENTKLVKGSRKPKANKWAKDAQGKKGHRSPYVRKSMVVLSHWGKNTRQAQKGPAGLSHYSRNDRIIWQDMMAIKKWAGRNTKPSIKGSPVPKVGSGL